LNIKAEFMKEFAKILFLYTLLIFLTCHTGYSQNNVAQADSARINNKTEQDTKDKTTAAAAQKENNGNAKNQQPVKKVKGARPDMSKAKGARPAYIQRQAGAGIPRGIGRPGGAGGVKPGKR
jgi:hypothetical protein